MTASIALRSVSKWYGNVVAVNDVSLEVHPGVTGLLGPNGAGKTTVLHMMAGLAEASEGEVEVLGQPVRDNPDIYHVLGMMSEHEAVYPFYSGRQFVQLAARLHGLDDVGAAAVDRAVAYVGLSDVQDRALGTYSRGNETAHQAGGVARARTRGADPGRAAERHRTRASGSSSTT